MYVTDDDVITVERADRILGKVNFILGVAHGSAGAAVCAWHTSAPVTGCLTSVRIAANVVHN
jgi:hypothetical protein